MKIAVLVKQVPSAESQLRLNPDTFLLERSLTDPVLNPFDLHAVETALRLSDSSENQTLVISMGPTGLEQSTKRALAMGIDEALHVTDDRLRGADIWVTANVLAKAISFSGAELVFAGTKASDSQNAAVPAYVAQLLGWDFAEVDSELELDRAINLKKPMVIAVGKNLNTPRLANFKGIAAAKTKPVAQLNLSDLGLADIEPKVNVVSQKHNSNLKAAKKLSGNSAEIAKAILDQIAIWNQNADLEQNKSELEPVEGVKVFAANEITEAAIEAARFQMPIVTNVNGTSENGFTKTIFDGSAEVEIKVESPCVVTRANSLQTRGLAVGVGGGVTSKAEIVFLAQKLNAELVGTAAACDKGFIEVKDLVGESGRSISPYVYLNFGVSGAYHHWVGVKSAKHVVSVNKDPGAEIVDKSDLIAVADADEVILALLSEMSK